MNDQSMWAAWIQEPDCVLIVAPGVGAWRLAPAAFLRSMGDRKHVIRARSQGHLRDYHHLQYDPFATGLKADTDCIGRRYLAIGPIPTLALVLKDSECDDLYGALDGLFIYQTDADRAARDVARLVTEWGGNVETHARR